MDEVRATLRCSPNGTDKVCLYRVKRIQAILLGSNGPAPLFFFLPFYAYTGHVLTIYAI